MPFSEKQREYFDNASHRWNLKVGATRSGKTYMDYFMIPKRIRARIGKPGLTVILGVTKNTIERNVLEPMRQIWGDQLVGAISSDNTCYLFGERAYCLGAEKVSQVSKLRGASVKYCYGDEVADWNEEVFELLKSRLDKPYSCFDGALNPQGPNHWLKAFLESDADIYAQHYTIFDNPFLPAKFVEDLCKEYAGTVYYKRYILGLWALAEGLVYGQFDAAKHITHMVPEKGLYYISIDYGTMNPFSAGLWCYDGERAVRIREFYYDGRARGKQLTDEEYYLRLEKLAGDLPIEYMIIDPSAASMIATIRKHGRFNVRRANNDVLNGIRCTAGLLNIGRILIHESCIDTIREFGSYVWDDKAIEDRPVKENDHAMDDIRYFCYTVLRRME